MTRNEMLGIMETVYLESPETLAGLTEEQVGKKIDLWYGALKSFDAKIVSEAVMKLLTNFRGTVRLAHIVQQIKLLTSPKEKTDEELWCELVDKSREAYRVLSELYKETRQAMIDEESRIADEEDDPEIRARKQAAAEAHMQSEYKTRNAELKQQEFNKLSNLLKEYFVSPERYIEVCFMNDADMKYERMSFFKRIGGVRDIILRNEAREG